MEMMSQKAVLGSVLGITSSAIFFGANLGITYITIPTLLVSSVEPASSENASSPTPKSLQKPETKASHLARQWQHMYNLGSKGGPFFGLLAAGFWLYTARQLPAQLQRQQKLLFLAAGLSVAIAPFTFGVMKWTNGELMRRAAVATKGESDNGKAGAGKGTVESYQTHDLLRWWAQLNIMRAMLHLGAIACAITALAL